MTDLFHFPLDQDAINTENLFCLTFIKYSTVAEAINALISPIFLSAKNNHLIPYKVCIEDIANQFEMDGQQKEKQGIEPKYHNRQHTKEVLLSLFLLLSQQKDNCSKADFSLWPPFSPHQKLLLMIAALGHDYLHPGGLNQKDAEFELASATAIKKILAKYTLPHEDIQIIVELILGTELKKAKVAHTYLKTCYSKEAIPWINRAQIMLTEADISASALPNYGLKLASKLASEWKWAQIQDSEMLLSLEGRKNFLENILFSSPHAQCLGLDIILKSQLSYLEKVLM